MYIRQFVCAILSLNKTRTIRAVIFSVRWLLYPVVCFGGNASAEKQTLFF